MQRTVWILPQATVKVYREDGNGGYLDVDPLPPHDPISVLEYCFLEGVTISARLPGVARRAVTGRGRRKLITASQFFDEVSMSVDHLFYKKADEYNTTNIFNPAQPLSINFTLDELTYSGVAPFENDSFRLSFARAVSFNATGRGSGDIEATAEFEAELLI